MRWRPLAVALSLVLAGCGAGAPGGPAETVTPADVPAAGPGNEQQRGDVVPGVADGEVADVDLLARAHLSAIGNRSYTWRERRSLDVDPANGSERVTYRQLARVESSHVYFLWSKRDWVRIGSNRRNLPNYTEYADGERRHIRYRYPASTDREYAQASRVKAAEHRYIGREAGESIRRYLDVERASIEGTTVDGDRHYRLVGRTADLPGVDPLEQYNVTAVIAPDGFVRSLAVSYRTTELNETRAISYTFEYDRVNETTVTEPDWTSETGGFGRG